MSDNFDDQDEFEEEFDFEEDESGLESPEHIVETELPPPTKRSPLVSIIVAVIVLGGGGWYLAGKIWGTKKEPQDATTAALEKIKGGEPTTTTENIPVPEKVEEITAPLTQPEPMTDLSPEEAPISSTQEPPKQVPLQEPLATPPASQKIEATEWTGFEKNIFEEETKETKEPKDKVTLQTVMEKLESQEQETSERIKALEDTLTQMVETVSNIGQGVGKVGQDMNSLSTSVQTLSEEVKLLKSNAAPSKSMEPPPKEEQPFMPEKPKVQSQQSSAFSSPIYRVHAIIPGRAWLKSNDGRTLTVTEGDTLEEYGKILVIDAPSGVVITSSGITLR